MRISYEAEDLNSRLSEYLDEDGDKFPVKSPIKAIRGKTLVKTNKWWKALVLVETGTKRTQLRLYGWRKDEKNDFKVDQKFNISPSYSDRVAEALIYFKDEFG